MTQAIGIRLNSPRFEEEVNYALDYFSERGVSTQYKLLCRSPMTWSGKPPLDHLIVAAADVELGYPHVQTVEWLGKYTLEKHTVQIL